MNREADKHRDRQTKRQARNIIESTNRHIRKHTNTYVQVVKIERERQTHRQSVRQMI